jgi:hypothetical protein
MSVGLGLGRWLRSRLFRQWRTFVQESSVDVTIWEHNLRAVLKVVSKILIVSLIGFVVIMLVLQALHVLPAGDSPVKTRLKVIFFFGGAVWFFLVAVTEEAFRWRGGTPMPLWLGRTFCLLCGTGLLLTAVLSVVGVLR